MRSFRNSPGFAGHIKTGKQGLKGAHRGLVLESNQARVQTSMDFEASIDGLHPDKKRWDYFLESSKSVDAMHAVEIHEFDPKSLHGKKTGTLEILGALCPGSVAEIRTWNVLVKGNLPRQDLISRFTADTKIRVRRTLQVKDL